MSGKAVLERFIEKNPLAVRTHEATQFRRNRERDEKVFARQQLLRLFETPLAVVRRLTPRAMPVAARRVRVMNGFTPVRCALRAAVAGRSESSCSAVGDQLQHAAVFGRDTCSVVVQVRGSVLRAHLTQRGHRRIVRATAGDSGRRRSASLR